MKQIIALGGGGFSMEPDNLLLDEYILKQSGKPVPKICFVPTATNIQTDSIIFLKKCPVSHPIYLYLNRQPEI